ncbi:MAG: RNA polymerase sigma factor [Acidobacteria bacterium]|nr:RNA polymerase sigma factor [Acidobacteriota bacterium]
MLTAVSSFDEAALLRRIESGDENAFDKVYSRHQGPVYRYALRVSGSPEIAEDVVQEVFLALIRGAKGFDPGCGSLSSYLYGMARNHTFRQLGASTSGVELEEETAAPETDPLEGLTQAEQVERVRSALAGLPAHYREIVALCEMEEMPYAEVAEMLGLAVGTVRSRLHRARALLLTRLSQESCRA